MIQATAYYIEIISSLSTVKGDFTKIDYNISVIFCYEFTLRKNSLKYNFVRKKFSFANHQSVLVQFLFKL